MVRHGHEVPEAPLRAEAILPGAGRGKNPILIISLPLTTNFPSPQMTSVYSEVLSKVQSHTL